MSGNILAKERVDLNRIQGNFADIVELAADPRFINGEYTLSTDDIKKYGINRAKTM